MALTQSLSRGVPAALLTALQAPVIYPVVLVYLDWPDAPVHLHSSAGEISFQSETFSGVGAFGSVALPDEPVALVARSATLRLLGVGDAIFDYLETPIRNRNGRVYWGALTERGGDLVGAFEIFAGYMDARRFVQERRDDGSPFGGDMLGVEIDLAVGPSARATASITHSLEDQTRLHPADTAGRHVINAIAALATLRWPEN